MMANPNKQTLTETLTEMMDTGIVPDITSDVIDLQSLENSAIELPHFFNLEDSEIIESDSANLADIFG
jgi:hypothetical protein